jgi:hypothetical protein
MHSSILILRDVILERGRDLVRRALGQKRDPFRWDVIPASYLLFVRKDERCLGIVLTELPDEKLGPACWGATAAEAPAGVETIAAFFAEHAHHVVAERVLFEKGKRLAEDYAHAWLASAAPAPPCPCPEIQPSPPSPSSTSPAAPAPSH